MPMLWKSHLYESHFESFQSVYVLYFLFERRAADKRSLPYVAFDLVFTFMFNYLSGILGTYIPTEIFLHNRNFPRMEG